MTKSNRRTQIATVHYGNPDISLGSNPAVTGEIRGVTYEQERLSDKAKRLLNSKKI